MPINNNLNAEKLNIKSRFFEKPITVFKDARKSKNIKLKYYDKDILNAAYDFLMATWSDDGNDSSRVSEEEITRNIEMAFEGKSLPLAVELYDLVFTISGINRIDTHQIVRTRIGSTYSQQCSGDRDWRHHNCLVPPAVFKDKQYYENYKQSVLKSKDLYSKMIDSKNISLQDARYLLPHNLETFIHWKINLVTFMQLYTKRSCTMTQTWEYNQIVNEMKRLTIEAIPSLKNSINTPCERGNCFYVKAGLKHNTNLYVPDKNHDVFDYNIESFFYNKTKNELVDGEEMTKPEIYIGFDRVTYDDYVSECNRRLVQIDEGLKS